LDPGAESGKAVFIIIFNWWTMDIFIVYLLSILIFNINTNPCHIWYRYIIIYNYKIVPTYTAITIHITIVYVLYVIQYVNLL